MAIKPLTKFLFFLTKILAWREPKNVTWKIRYYTICLQKGSEKEWFNIPYAILNEKSREKIVQNYSEWSSEKMSFDFKWLLAIDSSFPPAIHSINRIKYRFSRSTRKKQKKNNFFIYIFPISNYHFGSRTIGSDAKRSFQSTEFFSWVKWRKNSLLFLIFFFFFDSFIFLFIGREKCTLFHLDPNTSNKYLKYRF